ncbi:hypothetical protein AURDEDRAFT_165081 [Auricularia subglabra TFB-10046 SS5]|nr:hypothetical protein AURDEDRAFT_165081 [Auricularia subglabra TFB-10046 SS5]
MTNSAFTSDQESALNALFAEQMADLTELIKNNGQSWSAPPTTTPPIATAAVPGTAVDPTSAMPTQLRAAAGGPVFTPAVPAAAHLAPGFGLGAGAQDPLAEIMLHTAEFRTIAKLNPAYTRTASEQVGVMDGRLSIINCMVGKSFPNLMALLASFSVYFDILCFQLGASRGFEPMWTLSRFARRGIQRVHR